MCLKHGGVKGFLVWGQGLSINCDTTDRPFHVHFSSQQVKHSLLCDLRNLGTGGDNPNV